ncbi:MAG TPA: hypothetical protein VIF57_16230 [Polyangia bacterium]|jgi:hypothetical protein
MRNGLNGGLLVGALAFAAAAPACASKTCSTVGCFDQFTAKVQRADGSFPSGAHRIDVVADGVSLSCTFDFPIEALPGGGAAAPTCSSGLTAFVGPATVCTQATVSGGSTYTCDPIPGQYVESIALAGTPAQLHASQSVDGASILDVVAAPSYQDVQPNGPECGTVCRQASASWTLN